MERIQGLMKDYSLDYEEYFNRRLVGCDEESGQWDIFSRDIDSDTSNIYGTWNGHCDRFTAYGNRNSLNTVMTNNHTLYYCSSRVSETTPDLVFNNNNPSLASNSLALWFGCFDATMTTFFATDNLLYQSYGQYRQQFFDVQDDVDFVPWVVWDDDDLSLWRGPVALLTGSVQELYLISQDETQRVYMRRKLVDQWDRDNDGTTWNSLSDNRYTLQILKLRWFDAWSEHSFGTISPWIVDGQIDTWACDASQWFICTWVDLGGAYTDYKLPNSVDDGRVDILTQDISVRDWKVIVSPLRDPKIAFAEDMSQINPTVTLVIETGLYGKNRRGKIPFETLEKYTITVQTTFASKYFY